MRLLAALVLLPGGALAQSPEQLRCLVEDGSRVTITLWTPTADGPPTHCVEAPWLAGMAACAPNGGWGLSSPDGSLLDLVTDPREVTHGGPTFFAHDGPSEFVASASIGPGIPLVLEVAGPTFWRMRLDRATGQGRAYLPDAAFDVTCTPE